MQKLSTKEEHDAFEAVRTLTIVKESPTSTLMKLQLLKIMYLKTKVSFWLIRSRTNFTSFLVDSRIWINRKYRCSKIYGAGLLSSVGESKHCLTAAVEKVPFSIEACTSTTYDVTKCNHNYLFANHLKN